ncbi:glycoside hydrolase family 95 protein [Crepidotus variabilis]|uniref:Glycoside hydrolase family 95 protein n=1 Tax=Crepidotus variabilis TaxID=179855 RepID=A0A9P6E8Z7_9AGAR|nr:glycoside hydrolase family 95 protein [Crepidotus variabilis]
MNFTLVVYLRAMEAFVELPGFDIWGLVWSIHACIMRLGHALLHLVNILLALRSALSVPQGFPPTGNGLWYTKPAQSWSREWLPVGNGYLAAMVSGGTSQEAVQLNIESLWSGGPFADASYNGGNKQPSEQAATATEMQRIRQTIFQNSTGEIDNIESLATDAGQYGSYAGAGYLLSSVGISGNITNYGRWLDLDQSLARTSWTQNGTDFLRTTFCSYPTKACVQHTSSTKHTLPALTYAFATSLESGFPAPNITCKSQNTLLVSGHVTLTGGMAYALLFRLFSSTPGAQIRCTQFPVPFGAPFNGTLQVTFPSNSTASEAWIAWTGDTEYDIDAGTATNGYSFRGVDPVTKVTVDPSTSPLSDFKTLLDKHVADVKATLYASFAIDLGQKPDLTTPTDVLKSRYVVDGTASTNAYLDWLLFNYGRYMLASSARGVLPANLQGSWANGASSAWSADYHANINTQMNYWAAEITGLSSLTLPLFNYMEKTWAPRGGQTARLLYNITRGWVTHNEMNIFGHTGMKAAGNSAQWANYPEANAWMMLHVWDHFDHTNDVAWWKRQGWPLLKGVASFHLDKLIPDTHFNDSTLVVNPCNSPEQVPITFGCAHAQQLIWQLFNSIEKGFLAAGDNDTVFLAEIRSKRAIMDKGLKVGSWGQLQEWKVEKDDPSDTHRHLSHLIGLYPGYAISSFNASSTIQSTGPAKSYTKEQVWNAAKVSLEHRGDGNGPDADAGWEKVWRAAAWAQFGDASKFYHEISYALSENFAANLFSVYNPFDPEPIFQIDANLGFPAAVMNALVQAPDVPNNQAPLVIKLLPALPSQWPAGSIQGARIRGGITVDLSWRNGKFAQATLRTDATAKQRVIRVEYDDSRVAQFTSTPGGKRAIK